MTMIYETIPAKYLDHSNLARFLDEACVLKHFATFLAEQGVERLQEGEVTSGEAVNLGRAINGLKNFEDAIDIQVKDFVNYINIDNMVDLDVSKVDSYMEKVWASTTSTDTNGLDGFALEYQKWQEQIPQLAQKYLKGNLTKVEADLFENGSVQRQF